MRILASQKMFGYPSLKIRRLMRAGGNHCWGVAFVAATLEISSGRATELVQALLTDSLIAQVLAEDPDDPRYELTIKGRALGMARATKPIKRATAERLVAEFLQRVEEVNKTPDLLFWIGEALVFGSFVTGSPTLGDVDIAVMYACRIGPTLWNSRSKQRVATAQSNGRWFRNLIDKIQWPQREIELRLRKGLGALHIHDLRIEGKFIETLPHRRIYVRNVEMSPTRPDVVTPFAADSLNPPEGLSVPG